MKADNEAALTKYEAAIDRLQSSNEKAIGGLRADMERLGTAIFVQMISVAALVVALSVFIAYSKFFK